MIILTYIRNGATVIAQRELTAEEKKSVTSTVTNGTNKTITYYQGDEPIYSPSLEESKILKNISIDQRTMELIYSGFEFDGRHFSLSDKAQGNWAGMIGGIGAGILVEGDFPLTLSDMSDNKYLLSWENALLFCAKAVSTIKNHKKSGSDLKELVNQCITVKQISEIIDNRI